MNQNIFGLSYKLILPIFLLFLLALTSCGRRGLNPEEHALELSVTVYTGNNEGVKKQLDNPNNVLTSYLAERFGLKIKEILEVPPDFATNPAQAAQLWASAGMLPDIMAAGAEESGSLMNTGLFHPLDDYLANMPHYQAMLPKHYWPREANPEDGKTYAFFTANPNWAGAEQPSADDVVTPSFGGRALWVREDVLDAIGYSYTPVMEIKTQTVDRGIRPTAEQFRLNPPIDSPPALLEMLRRIKAANLKGIDGNNVIPFSMVSWETWHMGVMYDWGYWRINRAGEVDGYLGLPGAHSYLKWLWTAYHEGLIDPDYLVHRAVQLQEKVAAGRVAAGEYVPNALPTFAQLEQNIPGAIRHPIPFPKSSPDTGFFDTSSPFSYSRAFISKKIPDETMTKIAVFVDWLYSTEAEEILSWGPESAGLYTTVDEKRRFVDPALEEGMLNAAQEGMGPYYYGLVDPALRFSPTPIVAALGPTMMGNLVLREYQYTSNYIGLITSIVGSEPRFLGLPQHLEAANSDQSSVVQGVGDWYWSIFPQTYLPQLLKSANEQQFEERYKQLIDAFMRETNYAEAKQNMLRYFAKFPPEWD